jgi:hypothetical protein
LALTVAVATTVSVPVFTPVYVKTALPDESSGIVTVRGFAPVTVKVMGVPAGAL